MPGNAAVWLAVALVVMIGGLFAAAALGRKAKAQASAPGGGGTMSGGYILKITLILALGLACLFGGMFVITSYR
jgi:hypothetical protein